MKLQGTPFVVIKKNDNYVIGRSDSRHMLCMGNFNQDFVDVLSENDEVTIRIYPNGQAVECNAGEMPGFDGEDAIVRAKCGCYWTVPYEFDKWAEKVFPGCIQYSNKNHNETTISN